MLIGKAKVYLFSLVYPIAGEFPIDELFSNFDSGACGYLDDIMLDRETGMIKPEFEDLLGNNCNCNMSNDEFIDNK